MTKFIYKARKTNSTMKYVEGKEYQGQFITSSYSNILLIKNDINDSVLVYKFDFEYVRKLDVKEGE